jgi:hypothetical protein
LKEKPRGNLKKLDKRLSGRDYSILFRVTNDLRALPRLFEKRAHTFSESLSARDQLFNDFPLIIPINLDALCRRRRED